MFKAAQGEICLDESTMKGVQSLTWAAMDKMFKIISFHHEILKSAKINIFLFSEVPYYNLFNLLIYKLLQ
jgi:hypothetical protein